MCENFLNICLFIRSEKNEFQLNDKCLQNSLIWFSNEFCVNTKAKEMRWNESELLF
jgi:hypothetical protein